MTSPLDCVIVGYNDKEDMLPHVLGKIDADIYVVDSQGGRTRPLLL